MTQPALFGETVCGYCGRALAPVGDGSWRCVDCAPELARIRTLEEWGLWMRRKLRGEAKLRRELHGEAIAGAEGAAPDAPAGRGHGSAAVPRPPSP